MIKMKRTISLFTVLALAFGCGDGKDPRDGDDDNDNSGIDGDSGAADDGGNGDDGGTGSGSGETTGDETMSCGEIDFQVESVPPNVMLVLDKSGSMHDNTWDHDDDGGTDAITRWKSLFNVVDLVVGSFNESINFGAVLFPSEEARATYGSKACLVEPEPEVPVAPLNADNILDGIPGPNASGDDIQGATPATKGIQTAVEHLAGLDPEIDRIIILVTDGAANCWPDASDANELMELYDNSLPETIAAAYVDHAIPTYVVGIDILDEMTGVGIDGNPEANPFYELNQVAVAGGVARPGPEKFYNAINEIELQAALEEIAASVVSCEIPFEQEPPDHNKVTIEIGGNEVPMVEDCANEDGWTWINPDGPYDSIMLCGTACDMLAEFGELDATFGCPDQG
jgi:hypothetical protein